MVILVHANIPRGRICQSNDQGLPNVLIEVERRKRAATNMALGSLGQVHIYEAEKRMGVMNSIEGLEEDCGNVTVSII